MNILRFVDRVFSKIEMVFLVLSLSVMVIFAFGQVVLRNALGAGYLWADPIVRHLVLWAGFMGAALATRDERHISIDALTKFLSKKAKHVVAVVTSAFGAVVCYFLATAAWHFLVEEKAANDMMVLSIPTWVAIVVIPVGYGLLTFHFFVRGLENAI
jgi:TRAP-type C4-dicarboxylate transport system permease small subunit